MATFKTFEDMEAWKKARELCQKIYRATSDGRLGKDFALHNQMRRAIVSISSNIAEGFERSGDGEFIQFLSIAKGSCGELRSQLHMALDQEYLSKAAFEELVRDSSSVSRLLSGLINYLRNSDVRGSKYKKRETRQADAPRADENRDPGQAQL